MCLCIGNRSHTAEKLSLHFASWSAGTTKQKQKRTKKTKTMIQKTSPLVKAALSTLCLVAGASGLLAATNTANNQTGADQRSALNGKSTISTGRVDGLVWEFFKVAKDATTGATLSPRAERGLGKNNDGAFLENSNTTNGKKVIILSGKCDINDCARSTIMQIINHDPRSTAAHVQAQSTCYGDNLPLGKRSERPF